MDSKTKFDKDSPETYEQAKDLLDKYYKKQKATGDSLPLRPAMQSWTLHEDGVMVIIDGASGRKLEFVTNQDTKDKEKAAEQAEDAESAALDAEAKAKAAQLAAEQAEAEAKAAKAAAKAQAGKTNEQTAQRAEAKAKAEKK
jgi:hypothetical protein